MLFAPERIHDLTPGILPAGNVLYWMSREQRMSFNPGLLHARRLAGSSGGSLDVVFTLTDNFPGATLRHYDFMLRGLKEVQLDLEKKNIPLFLLMGNPVEELLSFCEKHKVETIVLDQDPLKVKKEWREELLRNTNCSVLEVDGHNIVPLRHASQKQEFGAYTLRPKINKQLEKFLEELPELEAMPDSNRKEIEHIDPVRLGQELEIDKEVKPVDWLVPGEKAAEKHMWDFIRNKLKNYASDRNDPNKDALSKLSPYLHFGQIHSLQVAISIIKSAPSDENSKAFLEELIVRKELSDNFCHYAKDYTKVTSFHDWAKKTHDAHRKDEREYLYSQDEFEQAKTHDPLWNAAQKEMVMKGKMHGYMRMYWAKKILEWTPDPETAMEIAIFLNDKYSLDGRDPNGYTGIAWSIGGVHDRAWTERPVFGKIRYMNYNGCKRKFDVEAYMGQKRLF